MQIYTLYIEDDRYSVPTVALLVAEDDGVARAEALGRLLDSPHHHAVDVWADDRFVCQVTAAGPRAQEPSAHGL